MLYFKQFQQVSQYFFSFLIFRFLFSLFPIVFTNLTPIILYFYESFPTLVYISGLFVLPPFCDECFLLLLFSINFYSSLLHRVLLIFIFVQKPLFQLLFGVFPTLQLSCTLQLDAIIYVVFLFLPNAFFLQLISSFAFDFLLF